MKFHVRACAVVLVLGAAMAAIAQPAPGDVFKEFWWDSLDIERSAGNKWFIIRVSEYWAPLTYGTAYGLTIDDLQGAERAELYVERAMVLPKTKDLAVQVNDDVWHPIPFPDLMTAQTGGEPHMQESVTFMNVPLNLAEIHEGLNTVRLRVDMASYDKAQNFIYGVAVRVYYNESKPRPEGRITAPAPGATVGNTVALAAEASFAPGIAQVDFIGYYEEYSMRNDGIYTDWQYFHFCDSIRHHLGTDLSGPDYSTVWNTVWLADQPAPMKVCARIVGSDGTIYMTEAVENLTLQRSHSVELVRPYGAPDHWNTRMQSDASPKVCSLHVVAEPGLAVADSAQALWTSWGPTKFDDQYLLVNGTNVMKLQDVGIAFVYWDEAFPDADCITRFSPHGRITQGVNTIGFTKGAHHGMGVSWPGVALKVRYNYDPSATNAVPPNPSARTSRISVARNTTAVLVRGGVISARLISPDGRVLASAAAKEDLVVLPTQTLAAGTCVLQVVGHDGSRHQQVIVTGNRE